jgi:hypothetical protein
LSSEGEGFANHLGLLPSPRVQTENDKRKKGLQDLWTSKRRFPAGLSLSPGRFAEKKGERGCNKARVFMIEFEFNFEFVCKDFENLPKLDSRVSSMIKRSRLRVEKFLNS